MKAVARRMWMTRNFGGSILAAASAQIGKTPSTLERFFRKRLMKGRVETSWMNQVVLENDSERMCIIDTMMRRALLLLEATRAWRCTIRQKQELTDAKMLCTRRAW